MDWLAKLCRDVLLEGIKVWVTSAKTICGNSEPEWVTYLCNPLLTNELRTEMIKKNFQPRFHSIDHDIPTLDPWKDALSVSKPLRIDSEPLRGIHLRPSAFIIYKQVKEVTLLHQYSPMFSNRKNPQPRFTRKVKPNSTLSLATISNQFT